MSLPRVCLIFTSVQRQALVKICRLCVIAARLLFYLVSVRSNDETPHRELRAFRYRLLLSLHFRRTAFRWRHTIGAQFTQKILIGQCRQRNRRRLLIGQSDQGNNNLMNLDPAIINEFCGNKENCRCQQSGRIV